jgi:uncharacterized membrane protein
MSGWIAVNLGSLDFIPPFDPFPFPLLSVVLSGEAVLLTAFVLIRQNRMSRQADQRSHLDLQINLLAEKEATKIIQMLELAQGTAVEGLARELRENLDRKED